MFIDEDGIINVEFNITNDGIEYYECYPENLRDAIVNQKTIDVEALTVSQEFIKRQSYIKRLYKKYEKLSLNNKCRVLRFFYEKKITTWEDVAKYFRLQNILSGITIGAIVVSLYILIHCIYN